MKPPLHAPAGRALALAALAALAVTGYAPPADAGGFYVPERGARALALGGAQVAGADDLNAQWLNPAALTRLTADLTLHADLGVVFTDQRFARADDAEVMRKDPRYADGFPEVDNSGPPFPSPTLAVASTLGTRDFVFSLGVYGPYAGSNVWPEDGPQRYSLIRLDAIELFTQLSVAWRISDRVSVGVGLQWVYAAIKQRLQISGYPGVFGWAEQPELDTLVEVDVTDPFTPSANLGVLVTPIDGFDIGLSAQLPVPVRATGTVQTRLPDHYYFSDVVVRGDAMEVDLTFPAILRLGLRLYEPQRWSLELAAVYELWSALETIAARPGAGGVAFENVPGVGTYQVRPFGIPQDHRDVLSLRLGGSWRPGATDGPVTLRAGALLESSSLPDRTTTVLKIDNDKLGFTLGATFHLGAVDLDLAAAWIGQRERVVTDSVKFQVNPLYDEDAAPYGDAGPHVVGDGTYGGSYVILATSVTAAF